MTQQEINRQNWINSLDLDLEREAFRRNLMKDLFPEAKLVVEKSSAQEYIITINNNKPA